MSLGIQRESVDVARFQRFKAGETVEEIAQSEGVIPDTVLSGIQRAAARERMILAFEIIDRKLRGAIENERIKERIREEHRDQIMKAVELLLSGKRSVVTHNQQTGDVVQHEIVDPDVIAMGVEQVIKILALEDKPTANPIVANVHAAEFEHDEPSSTGLSFETPRPDSGCPRNAKSSKP